MADMKILLRESAEREQDLLQEKQELLRKVTLIIDPYIIIVSLCECCSESFGKFPSFLDHLYNFSLPPVVNIPHIDPICYYYCSYLIGSVYLH